MKELLEYIIEGITGTRDFEIEETKNNGSVNFLVKAVPENIGLIIGKKGRTIKAIRTLLRVRATLEKKAVTLSISEA